MGLEWHGDRITAATEHAVEQGVFQAAEHVLTESNKIVPHEQGDLERSGSAQAEGNRAVVAYTSVYAARQHEELGWRHNNGRQAKYLETALHAEGDTAMKLAAAIIRRALS